jgi:hypothetical protein
MVESVTAFIKETPAKFIKLQIPRSSVSPEKRHLLSICPHPFLYPQFYILLYSNLFRIYIIFEGNELIKGPAINDVTTHLTLSHTQFDFQNQTNYFIKC